MKPCNLSLVNHRADYEPAVNRPPFKIAFFQCLHLLGSFVLLVAARRVERHPWEALVELAVPSSATLVPGRVDFGWLERPVVPRPLHRSHPSEVKRPPTSSV